LRILDLLISSSFSLHCALALGERTLLTDCGAGFASRRWLCSVRASG